MAALACVVGTVAEPAKRMEDVHEMRMRVVPERGDLGPLEGDRRTLGIVFVIGGNIARGIKYPGKVPGQRLDPLCRC